jgi:small-conductance mechanosensitive channel
MFRNKNMFRIFFNYKIWTALFLLFFLSACSGTSATQTSQISLTPTQISTPSPAATEIAAVAPDNETPAPTATPLLGDIVATRVPEPTATPGALEQAVIDFTIRKGVASTKFLGLSVPDWINLGISIAYIIAGYLLGTWVIRRLLPRLVRRTPSTFDDELLSTIGPEVRWLVVLLILNLSTDRLTFVSSILKVFLKDIYFILIVVLLFQISWKLVDLATKRIRENLVREGRETELGPIILIGDRLGRSLVVIIGVTILLDHFGVNVTALTAALGIGGLAISLAAKDTVADAIAGMIVLLDRPFRVGDRIEIQGVGTWGDVTEVGLRTTRIRTRDNRMVIVPNSIISANQVINYSYPDPRYRVETHVDVPHGIDVETVRRLLIDTLTQVEGVLTEKPVDALYIEMIGPAIRFRLRWWIASYMDTRRMFDRVHTAIQYALNEAGIVSPYITDNVNLLVDQETSDRLSRAFKIQQADGGKRSEEILSPGSVLDD